MDINKEIKKLQDEVPVMIEKALSKRLVDTVEQWLEDNAYELIPDELDRVFKEMLASDKYQSLIRKELEKHLSKEITTYIKNTSLMHND